ncbi:hypothetical protein RHMOL_Rhmol02G0146200 [Rhododendron molle]|uniref:Uncharacterized protein n=1 Tax=Rhododendron molle TaxID=49168 RepID=A0ACC0PRJ8_RHOML|nr:hypothetical protein RHMOL_Rhmol02G0146200 [Rhododendron molle]
MPSVWFLWVLFAGEKIGEGIGRTRKEAQHHAAEGSLMNLACEILYFEAMPSIWFLQVLFAAEKIGEGIGWKRKEALHHAAEGSLMNFASEICLRERKFVKELVGQEGKPSIMPQRDPLGILSVYFAGEKIGEGFGRTRREALYQAVEGSLMNLASEIWYFVRGSGFIYREKIAEGIGRTRREAQHHASKGFHMNFAGEIWRSCYMLGFYRSSLRQRKLVKELVAQEGKPSIRPQSDPT